jgi:VanZ family protein
MIPDHLCLGLLRCLLILAVLIVSVLAFGPQIELVPGGDKPNHVLAFVILAFLLDYSLPDSEFGGRKILALLTYGVFIESVQYLLPNRHFSLEDVLADILGVGVYVISIPLYRFIPVLARLKSRSTEGLTSR